MLASAFKSVVHPLTKLFNRRPAPWPGFLFVGLVNVMYDREGAIGILQLRYIKKFVVNR
jgi:hypothetical protein